MKISIIFAIVGACAGTAGSIVTAFGANRALKALFLGHLAHDQTIIQLATRNAPVPIFTGLDRQYKKAEIHGTRLVWLGVSLLATGFILQMLSELYS